MYQEHSIYIPPDEETTAGMLKDHDHPVLISIETTGLYARSAFVFMFTAVYYESGTWHKVIMLAGNRRDERPLLSSLHAIVRSADILYSFGHFSFSSRFLSERYENMNGPGAEFFPRDLEIADIQHQLKSIRYLLPPGHLARHDIEKYVGFCRRSDIKGKKIADTFAAYEKTMDEGLRQMLILHQTEDIDSLFRVHVMEAYCRFAAGHFRVIRHGISPEDPGLLIIEAVSDDRFPSELKTKDTHREIILNGISVTITVPVFYGKLKYFLPGQAKDYYYLPDEDRAIHRSVAVFVDKAHRRKATKDTCYTTCEGTFLECPRHSGWDPVFKTDFHSKGSYILYDRSQWNEGPYLPLKYALMIIPPFPGIPANEKQ